MSTFKVKSSKNNWPEVSMTYVRPKTISDPAWNDLVGNEAAKNDLALKAWVVEAQRVAREGKTPEAGQAKVNAWRYKGDAAPVVMNLGGVEIEGWKLQLLKESNPDIILINYVVIDDDGNLIDDEGNIIDPDEDDSETK